MNLKDRTILWILKGLWQTIKTGKDNLRTKIAVAYGSRKISRLFEEAEMGEDTKKWWQSRTLIVNALTGIAGILTALTMDKGLDPQVIGYLATGLAIVNMILRTVTYRPIGK